MAKVLIAEDCLPMRRIAKNSIEKGGHEVIEATNGSEAVQLAKSQKPQIILLDAEMPEMDGWEACKEISSGPDTKSIPVLICTGHDLSDEQDQLKEAGAKGYIVKPYQVEQILKTIKKFIK